MKKIVKKNLKLDKEVIASLSENEMAIIAGGGSALYSANVDPNCPRVPMTDKPNCTETINKECELPSQTEDKFCMGYTTNFSADCHMTAEDGCQIIISQSCGALTDNCFMRN